MKLILQRLVQDPDKSFIVYHEKEPFFSSPWHYHPEYELLLILKSTGKCIIGDQIEHFKEGDLFVLGTELPHVFDNDASYMEGGQDLEAQGIVVQFLPDFLGKEFLQAPEFQALNEVLKKSARGMKISGITRHLIADKMNSMLDMDGLQRLTALLSIFDILSKTAEFELLASRGFISNFEASSSERFQKVTNYIMKNFTDDIPLSSIAEVANMTPTNFCTFFKNFYRQTFVEYLNNIRIGYACKLLGEDGKNISEIAYESGFKNISNFNRQFKKNKGVSPAAYRKSLSKKYQRENQVR
jgi:AraC-like DNA-binding protein